LSISLKKDPDWYHIIVWDPERNALIFSPLKARLSISSISKPGLEQFYILHRGIDPAILEFNTSLAIAGGLPDIHAAKMRTVRIRILTYSVSPDFLHHTMTLNESAMDGARLHHSVKVIFFEIESPGLSR
jgi:hypothetical protein